jgi:predicted nucleic acid-binding Zn ribbon protein
MVQIARRPWGEVDEGRLVSDPNVSQIRTGRLSVVPPAPGGTARSSTQSAEAMEALAQRRARRIALALMVISALVVIAVITAAWVLLRGA